MITSNLFVRYRSLNCSVADLAGSYCKFESFWRQKQTGLPLFLVSDASVVPFVFRTSDYHPVIQVTRNDVPQLLDLEPLLLHFRSFFLTKPGRFWCKVWILRFMSAAVSKIQFVRSCISISAIVEPMATTPQSTEHCVQLYGRMFRLQAQ